MEYEEMMKKDDGLPSLAFVMTKNVAEFEIERVAFASTGHTIEEAQKGIAYLMEAYAEVKRK